MSIAGQQETVYMPAVTKLYNGNAKIKLATIKKRVNHNSDGTLPNVQLKATWTDTCDYCWNIARAHRGVTEVYTRRKLQKNHELAKLYQVLILLRKQFSSKFKRYSDEFKHDIVLRINGTNFKTITNVGTSITLLLIVRK